MHSLVVTFALIGALGVGSQWLAWRLRLPAIVLMLAAGILAGPVFHLIDPKHDFGDALGPMVSVAVALILFEGGLSLNFAGLRDAGGAVRRLVFLGAPLGWLTGTLTAHYVAGLSWPVAAVFGGILVVTGPTVITPLLRQAHLSARPASVLRWEAIVNDSVGALFAVLAYEVAATISRSESLSHEAVWLAFGICAAGVIGWLAGLAMARFFRRGEIPEYMKAPALFAAVIAVFAGANEILEESGLLSVTVMGMVMGNASLPSLGEMRRFKEHVTVLLVSGVFVILAATMDRAMLALLDWRAIVFVLAMMLIARPVAIWISLIDTKLDTNEKALIAWVGPRGVVAVAVSGFFATKLADLGFEEALAMAPLAFALVAATVVVHGFSVTWVARTLGLTSSERPGVLIVGGSNWCAALAKALQEQDIPVLAADRNWRRLKKFRQQETPIYYGEILSEAAEHTIDLDRFAYIVAATENDAYNALVCTDFGPEFGRSNVYQLGRVDDGGDDPRALPPTLGGRMLFRSGASYYDLESKIGAGWRFTRTKLSDEYSFDQYLTDRAEGAELLTDIRPDGSMTFATVAERPKGKAGDVLLSFAPKKAGADDAMKRKAEKRARTDDAQPPPDPERLPG